MATTTRLSLFKPAGSDLVDRVTNLNNNFDLLDSKMPAVVCTSSTRPTGGSLYDGLIIYERDTGNVLVWDSVGTKWDVVVRVAAGGSSNAYILGVSRSMAIAFGSTVGTTSGSGDYNIGAAIITATGWAQLYRVIVYNGDFARTNMTIANQTTTFPNSSHNIRAWTGNTAAVIASTACRFDWVAMGI